MSYINENFLNLQKNYLFSTIIKKVEEFTKKNPDKKVIKLGIGDVTKPLIPACVEALHAAVDEMGKGDSFKGYGVVQGYPFLREAIVKNDYNARNIELDISEVFVSDGSKCDCANFSDILSRENVVAIVDPVYPVYVDTNVMDGRSGKYDIASGEYENIKYIPINAQNKFKPQVPNGKVDIIYLCLPNNPTGTVLTKEDLKEWVNYAKKNKAIILFDSAYEAYITNPEIPRSIYEIEGSKEVAVEFRSYSKTAGFTGVRCAYTIVPKELKGYTKEGEVIDVQTMWQRRTATKFNGVSYMVQRAAEATYSLEGKKQVEKNIKYYMGNAMLIKNRLDKMGYETFGGVDSPYVWFKVPKQYTSWEFFDKLLEKANVVGTPGSGFGPNGEGYFRLTAFGTLENTKIALDRMEKADLI